VVASGGEEESMPPPPPPNKTNGVASGSHKNDGEDPPRVCVNKGEETSSIVHEHATHELARTKLLVKAFFAYAEGKYESRTSGQATSQSALSRSPDGEVETN